MLFPDHLQSLRFKFEFDQILTPPTRTDLHFRLVLVHHLGHTDLVHDSHPFPGRRVFAAKSVHNEHAVQDGLIRTSEHHCECIVYAVYPLYAL